MKQYLKIEKYLGETIERLNTRIYTNTYLFHKIEMFLNVEI